MAAVQASVEVRAPIERAWSAVTDFEARPRWSPRVKEARILDGAPLKEGSRIALKVDGSRFTPTVVEMRRPDRLALVVRGPGFRAHHLYTLQPAPAGTLLTLSARYGGPLGVPLSALFRGSFRRDLTEELQAVKRAAEAGP